MPTIFRLRNVVQSYDWGSPDWIPALLGQANPDRKPCAELWMGAHPKASSAATLDAGEKPLAELIAEAPDRMLGAACAERFGGSLPYLFKLLAAGRPLSIQAHPNLEQAGEGWDRENLAGIALDSPVRNYKDRNHKPEIICALTPFRAMCGFRAVDEIKALLDALAFPPLAAARTALDARAEAAALKAFLLALFDLNPDSRKKLGPFVREMIPILSGKDTGHASAWSMLTQFFAAFPEDPAALSPLYLNTLDLSPGEAVFLPSGVLHAYVEGFGVELMANSDNVLRGGLTTKHVDMDELVRVLRFESFLPDRLNAIPIAGSGLSTYSSPAPEFALSTFRGTGADSFGKLPQGSPSILICVEGKLGCSDGTGSFLNLNKGESVFVAASAPAPTVSGNGAAFIAGVPAISKASGV